MLPGSIRGVSNMNTIKISACAAAAAALLGGTGFANAADYANVISATPVTGSVPVPRQACADGQQVVQQAPSGAGALVGAIVGGVIGNHFGAGFGRVAATGLGVVAGSAIGNQAEINNSPATAVPVRNCQTVTQYENQIVGYDVVYEYNGQRYSTRTANDPGPQLAIDVHPSGNAALDRGGPPPTYADAAPAYAPGPGYAPAPPAYYAPAPAYYGPAPYAAPYYVGPTIGIGFVGGYGHGYHHGYYRHW
jgi:uncharacterized protein YcfJ